MGLIQVGAWQNHKDGEPCPLTPYIAGVCLPVTLCSPHSALHGPLYPTLWATSSTPTSVAATVIDLLTTPDLYVSPSRSSLHCTEECPVGGAEALQRLRVWNKPGFLLPRPAPPSNLSPWMAPSFARLHIQTRERLPQLLPPIYCLGSTHLASVVLPSAHA